MTIQSDSDVHVTRTITVPLAPEAAFDLFTARMSEFWPTSHSIGAAPFEAVVIEPWIGGRWYERSADGSECQWGRVLAWESPHRLVLAWQLDADWRYDPEFKTDVDITFVESEPGHTKLALRHGHLERFGDRADELKAVFSSPNGWGGILDAYRAVGAH